MDSLAELMNFDYKLYEAPDKQWGRMSPDKTWNGVIRELIDGVRKMQSMTQLTNKVPITYFSINFKKADIAAGAFPVMAERESVIDYTVPFYDLVGVSIMMKKVKEETSLFKFLTVLEDTVWGCILGAYFFTSLLMWVFDRFSPYSFQNNQEKYKDDDERRYFDLKECLWFCMTSLTPQVSYSQCGNIIIFLPLGFYVKSSLFSNRVVERPQRTCPEDW